MVIVRCALIMICLLFSSCSNRKSSQLKNNVDPSLIDTQNRILDVIIQQEAMLVDIPIPLYDERILPSHSVGESNTLVFGYKSPLSCAQVSSFFLHQMERYGWQHLVSFETNESLLQFASPDRFCTVIIKPGPQLSHSLVFIYIKKAST